MIEQLKINDIIISGLDDLKYNNEYCRTGCVVNWLHEGEQIVFENIFGFYPSPDFTKAALLLGDNNLIITNESGNVLFSLSPPEKFLKIDLTIGEQQKHKYSLEFTKFLGYNSFNDLQYLEVLINSNYKEFSKGIVYECQYLDFNTGKFLPFSGDHYIQNSNQWG